jgi:hypothetical protein
MTMSAIQPGQVLRNHRIVKIDLDVGYLIGGGKEEEATVTKHLIECTFS